MSIERLKDGRYRIRYFRNATKKGADGTSAGQRMQETLGHSFRCECGEPNCHISRQQAERIYHERAAKRTAGQRMTFRQLAKEYQDVHGPEMAENSRERTEQACRLHLIPFFGEMLVEDMKPGDFKKYRNERLTAEESPASPATVNREWNILRAILNHGVAGLLIDRNPMPRGAVKPLATTEKLVYFERDEWQRFITAFDDDAAWRQHVGNMRHFGPVKLGAAADVPRLYGAGRNPESEATKDYLARLRATVPVCKALLYTGSRLNEILALRWESVDMKRGVVTIAQPKAKKAKTLPISASLRETLEALPAGIGKAFVFTRPDGEPFFDVEVQRAFTVAKKMAKIRSELTPHSIRHTFASWLAIAGTPLRTIQELLGHADIRMAIRYAHLSPAHLADAVKTIDILAAASGTQVAPEHKNAY